MNKLKTIKILFVLGNNVIYGTEKYVIDIASRLNKEKFEVFIAIPEPGPISETLQKLQLSEISYSNGRMNFFTLKGTISLFFHILKNRFRVIHANSGIVPCIIGFFLGIKLRIENKHGLYFEEEIKNLSFLKKLKEKIKQHFVDYVFVTSTYDKNIVVKYFNFKEQKIRIIRNRVDFKSLKFVRERQNNFDIRSEIKIGTVGRLTFQKSQQTMIKAMKEIVYKYGNAKLEIIGTGEDKNALLELISNLNLSDNIKVSAYSENIMEKINEFDIFLLTSKFEGITYAVQEAMGMGIPVVSTFVGGLQDLLIDKVNSMIIPVDESVKTSQIIIELIENKKLYEAISRNGINSISNNSIEKMIKEISEVYYFGG